MQRHLEQQQQSAEQPEREMVPGKQLCFLLQVK